MLFVALCEGQEELETMKKIDSNPYSEGVKAGFYHDSGKPIDPPYGYNEPIQRDRWLDGFGDGLKGKMVFLVVLIVIAIITCVGLLSFLAGFISR